MKSPGKLFHATPTTSVKGILEQGLLPLEDGVNLSTKDESDLIVFFGFMNGIYDYEKGVVDTVTLLEVDTTGLDLEWPGQDGDHHFVCREVIPPERVRVVSVSTLEQTKQWWKEEMED